MTTRSRLLGIAVMALALTVVLAPAGGAAPPLVREIFFGDAEETACKPQRAKFPIETVQNVYVCVVWRGVSGTFVERLIFHSPDGYVYQVLPVPFATPGADPVAAIDVEGRTIPVVAASPGRRGEVMVVARFPVAGTTITQHHLAGPWVVEVSLNGRVLDRDSFTLQRGR